MDTQRKNAVSIMQTDKAGVYIATRFLHQMHLSKTGAAEIVNKAVGERPKINLKMHQQS